MAGAENGSRKDWPPRLSRWRLFRPRLAAACLALATAACLFETATPIPRDELRLEYIVTPPALPAQSIAGAPAACRVDILIRAWPEGRPRIFQAPVYYTDNPAMPLRGIKAAELTVADRRGNPLSPRDTLMTEIGLDGNFIALPESAYSISYALDLDPKDPDRFGIPVPGMGKGVDLIDGAYFFILPLLGDDYASQWRTPGRFSLEFRPASGRILTGTDAKMSLATNYELMFLRAAWNPLKSKTFAMPNHEVTIYATSSESMDLDRFGAQFLTYIRLAEDSLMPLPTYRYFAGRIPSSGALKASKAIGSRRRPRICPWSICMNWRIPLWASIMATMMIPGGRRESPIISACCCPSREA